MKDKFDNKIKETEEEQERINNEALWEYHRKSFMKGVEMFNDRTLLVDDEFENSVAHNAGWL